MNFQFSKKILAIIWLPLFALAALASFYIVWTLFDLPSKEEVVEIARAYFDQYGLITVLLAAFLEGILFAGWYFPGSFVIVLAVVLAGRDIPQIIGITIATTVGFIIAHLFNYYIGKHGWYRLLTYMGFGEPIEKAQAQLTKYGPRAIFFTYWHPNLAALTATAAGILKLDIVTFLSYSIVAASLWDIFWAIIGVSLGQAALAVIGPKFVTAFIAAWIAGALGYSYYRRTFTGPMEQTVSKSE